MSTSEAAAAGTTAAAPEAAVECKKPRRKGTDVKNKCAARGVVTVITSSCVISTDFALSITKSKKQNKNV